ncbi:PCMD domain-containing protein [Flammeovirga sp. SJP92]|uniref:PCMD domain-containing protein n=1 Tax=Flammeovirga sp. SJP92 TaxID=1775430 RepID=UPI0007885200|nr:PCMD domain-containing protein [Flammeovirga sp. SJP92]KXX68517.1 hypothetical protein AVL50_22390 [Flammeovirga sp. SJP92]
MMKILRFTIICTLAFSLSACIDWDHFGLSPKAEIIDFQLEGQSGISEIDSLNRLIKVPLDSSVDRTSIAPSLIKVSSLASVEPGEGEKQSFLDTVEYVVTAEDGTTVSWDIIIKEAENQIPFGDFTTWFEQGSGTRSYFLPGNSLDTSPWRSGDKGAADVTIPTYPRTLVPMPSLENAEYAQLETKSSIGVLAAGSLFVGDIQGSGLTDVQIDFGFPFTSRPSSFSLSFQYEPKEYSKDGTTVTDKSDIYVLLQVREGDNRYRLGTGWVPRSDETVTDWSEITVPIVLGQSNDFADYMQPSPDKEELPEVGYYSDVNARPTHIIVVFSSSAEGADLKSGAVGSILRIRDFKLNY